MSQASAYLYECQWIPNENFKALAAGHRPIHLMRMCLWWCLSVFSFFLPCLVYVYSDKCFAFLLRMMKWFDAFTCMCTRREERMRGRDRNKQVQQHWCSKLFCPKTHQIKCNAYLIMCLCVCMFGVCTRNTPSPIHHWNSSKSNWSTYSIKLYVHIKLILFTWLTFYP